eukprot:TRINITY_DN9994_c0_g2_i2.p1 TRINITY_DN9994_c0_g2~~TRINITY_DN9994_c0_g2_i2.p1  ORF type:complete len:533 (+),score=112.59 TRINITY_DN9994_c0_g2_i2:50-1648(+)
MKGGLLPDGQDTPPAAAAALAQTLRELADSLSQAAMDGAASSSCCESEWRAFAAGIDASLAPCVASVGRVRAAVGAFCRLCQRLPGLRGPDRDHCRSLLLRLAADPTAAPATVLAETVPMSPHPAEVHQPGAAPPTPPPPLPLARRGSAPAPRSASAGDGRLPEARALLHDAASPPRSADQRRRVNDATAAFLSAASRPPPASTPRPLSSTLSTPPPPPPPRGARRHPTPTDKTLLQRSTSGGPPPPPPLPIRRMPLKRPPSPAAPSGALQIPSPPPRLLADPTALLPPAGAVVDSGTVPPPPPPPPPPQCPRPAVAPRGPLPDAVRVLAPVDVGARGDTAAYEAVPAPVFVAAPTTQATYAAAAPAVPVVAAPAITTLPPAAAAPDLRKDVDGGDSTRPQPQEQADGTTPASPAAAPQPPASVVSSVHTSAMSPNRIQKDADRPEPADDGRQPGGSDSDSLSALLSRHGLTHCEHTLRSNGITAPQGLYLLQSPGRDLGAMGIPGVAQTCLLTIIRDHWVGVAARHRAAMG